MLCILSQLHLMFHCKNRMTIILDILRVDGRHFKTLTAQLIPCGTIHAILGCCTSASSIESYVMTNYGYSFQ